MSAININNRGYRVSGVTKWDDGRTVEWTDFKDEPIVCPQVTRYGPEVESDDRAARRFGLPKGSVGYTITTLTCEVLNAAERAEEAKIAEAHFEIENEK